MSADPVVGRITFAPEHKLPAVPYRSTLDHATGDLGLHILAALHLEGDAAVLSVISAALAVRGEQLSRFPNATRQWLSNGYACCSGHVASLAQQAKDAEG